MISLTITIEDLSGVLQVFNTVQIRKWTGTGTPDTLVTDSIALSDYTTISGTDTINNREGVSDILLGGSYNQYYFTDPAGYVFEWYISRYYNTTTGTTSGWSYPIQGEEGESYLSVKYPPEINYR